VAADISSQYPFLNAAFPLIANGVPVLPVNPGKTPEIKGGNGCRDATLDPELVAAWGTGKYRFARVAAAPPAGKMVLDVDVGRGAKGREQFIALSGGLGPEDMPTPTATTPSGGWHLWFLTGGAEFPGSGKVPGHPGLDIKANGGGYVLVPMGSSDRVWLKGKPSKPMLAPPWLIEAAAKGGRRGHSLVSGRGGEGEGAKPAQAYPGIDSRYGRATVERIVADIAAAADGFQEATFSAGALKVARLIASGDLGPDAVEAVRQAAYGMASFDPRRPWARREIDRKIERALERGRADPWVHQDWTRGLWR
jgi:hypothetical protein